MSETTPSPGCGGLLDVLEKGGALSATRRQLVRSFADSWGIDPFAAVLETRVMDETRLAQTLARCLGLDYVRHLTGITIPREAFTVVPFAEARAHGVLPLGWTDEPRRFWCVVANPLCGDCLTTIRRHAGDAIRLGVAEMTEIRYAIDRLYPIECQVRCELRQEADGEGR